MSTPNPSTTEWVPLASSGGPPGPSGAIGPQGVQGAPGLTGSYRTGQTWAMVGVLTALTLPGIFIPKLAGQTTTLIGVRAKIASGTSIVAQMRRNGTNVGSPITITTTAATTTLSQALSDGDLLDVVLTTPTGSPIDLSLTAILEHLAAAP